MRWRDALLFVPFVPFAVQCSSSTASSGVDGGASGGEAGSGGVSAGGTSGSPAGGARASGGSNDGGAIGAGAAGAAHTSGGASSGGAANASGGASSGGASHTGGQPEAGADASESRDASADSSTPVTDGARDAAPDARSSDAGPPGPFGSIRFVDAAPDAPALDVCIKKTSDGSYTGAPVFRARGTPAGLPFGSTSAYLALGFDAATFYDFEFVAASTTSCAPPLFGSIGNRLVPSDASTTVAIYEYQFSPVVGYNAAQIADQGAPSSARADVRFYYAAQGTSETADFRAKLGAGSPAIWFSGVGIGSGTAFHTAAPGSYAFAALRGGTATVLAQRTGVDLVAGDPIDVFLYPSDATHFGLLRCPSATSAVVAACDQ